jgi:arginase family enzyme
MIKHIKIEGNRDLDGEEIGIVVNNSDDEGSAEVGVNCRDAAYHIGTHVHDLFRGSGARLRDEAHIDFSVKDTPGNSDPKAKKLEAVVESATEGADAVQKILESGKTPLSLGGNHTRGLDVIGALRYCHEHGIEMGLIWVDAHADLNTPETTPSGNIHGMVSAVLTGRGPKELIDLLRGAPFLKPENIMYIGLNDVDDQEGVPSTERQYLEELKILGVKAYEMDEVKNPENEDEMPQHILDAITEMGARLEKKGGKLWIELDADVFRKEDMPAAVMDNVRGGMRVTQGYHLFDHIGCTTKPLGMGASEISGDKDSNMVGAEIIARCVGKTMGIREPLYDELKRQYPDSANVYTLDPAKEQYYVGSRRFYKEPGCEYVEAGGNKDCFVVKDGQVIEIKRFAIQADPQDIALGTRIRISDWGSRYLGQGEGTIERIIIPYTERETDHILTVRMDDGRTKKLKIGEVEILS